MNGLPRVELTVEIIFYICWSDPFADVSLNSMLYLTWSPGFRSPTAISCWMVFKLMSKT